MDDGPRTQESDPPGEDTSTRPDDAARRDYVDLRDQIYQPSLSTLHRVQWPEAGLLATTESGVRRFVFGVRDQRARSDCVGQALAALIDIQVRLRDRDPAECEALDGADRVSATMLYRMARYHDAYGELGDDAAALASAAGKSGGGVRTLRSAIKAFYHHGASLAASADACEATWPDEDEAAGWLTREQAGCAENRALGAYYRLLPILNHYHAALRETETILVSARTHDGWNMDRVAAKGGRIDWDPARPGDDDLGHAFLIVGYTGEGFLVLNSWGEEWGRFRGPDNAPLAGVALWTYQDWAANVLDGWVLRLGLAGTHVFPYSIDEQGVSAGLKRSLGASAGSVPHRELRGQFLNLEYGDFVETGVYATPREAAAEFDETMRAVVKEPKTKAIVLRFPGFLEPLDRSFQRAASLRDDYRHHGIETANFFWSANFASQILQVVTSTAANESEGIGASGQELDRRIELALSGIGRALWRDIGSSSFRAVFDIESRRKHQPGHLGRAVIALARACREANKPIHVIAEGAGAMVAEDLVNLATHNREEWSAFRDSLSSVTLVFATVPVDDAHKLIMEMARMKRKGKAATILVPDEPLEEKLSFAGYGGTVSRLMSRAFVDRRRGHPRPMLGMSFTTMKGLAGGMFAGDGDRPNAAETRQKMAMETRIRQVKLLCEPIKHSPGMRTDQKTTLLSGAPDVQRRVKELILNTL